MSLKSALDDAERFLKQLEAITGRYLKKLKAGPKKD
jgi:hypothetical protein